MAKTEQPDGRMIDQKTGPLPSRGAESSPTSRRDMEKHQLNPTHRVKTFDWAKK